MTEKLLDQEPPMVSHTGILDNEVTQATSAAVPQIRASDTGKLSLAALFSSVLAACGGGGSDTPVAANTDPGNTTPPPAPAPSSPAPVAPTPKPDTPASPAPAPSPSTPTSPAPPAPAPSMASQRPDFDQAARFLNQATFGATQADVEALTQITFGNWLDSQIALPASLHQTNVDNFVATTALPNSGGRLGTIYSLWKVFASAPDQLRQRMAFALSEVFVVSLVPGIFLQEPRMGAGYADILTRNALGNYRTLLEQVSLSPAMGLYLSHMKNRKEDPSTGRVPDENYAREVMQLFSIGLVMLNQNGTPKLDSNGKPIETYTNADVSGLAKVFTGFAWAGPDTTTARFSLGLTSSVTPSPHAPNHVILPMQAYPQFHSTSEKKFLGVTIPAQSTPNAMGDLKIALDTIFEHPNVPPFVSKQLIQRLVTSNPSPEYVKRVADVFANNGQGVRGDLAAVTKAVLLDDEARLSTNITNSSGKLREPAVRLIHWMRTFQAQSTSGQYRIDDTADSSAALGQSPLYSASVFNFFRPGYVPPSSRISSQSLVAPEFQITNETTVAGYLNFIRKSIDTGAGRDNDVKATYRYHLTLANNPAALVSSINALMANNGLSITRQKVISDAVTAISATTDVGRLNRVKLAAFLVMASPEYILQN
jgi:uncharacterized protein (DUF1800 family)